MAAKNLMNNINESMITKGKYKGEDVFISHMPMILTDLPFDFKCLQFPMRLVIAMTINKLQGLSLEVCGINLEFPISCMDNYTSCVHTFGNSHICIITHCKKTKILFISKL